MIASSLLTNVIAGILVGLVLSAMGTVVVVVFKRMPRELGQLSRDWRGQEARPGFPAVPGVPERLETVEHGQQVVKATLVRLEEYIVKIDHEMHPNSGKSIKDTVDSTAAAVEQLKLDVAVTHRLLAMQPPPETKGA